MYVHLLYRRNSVQQTVKKLWLPVRLEQVLEPGGQVNETMLLYMLPAGWLPTKPGDTLLSIANPQGSTGLRGLTVFKPWARHFDCYVLELWHD